MFANDKATYRRFLFFLNSVAKLLFKFFDLSKEIEVIPNFIDFNRFKKTNKDHFKKAIAPDGEKLLIHVSNFRKVKRVDDVVKIFAQVNESITAKLLLVGDGPERQNIEFLCRQLGLCSHVRFLGKQDAVEELLAISDVFLMPSASESFGLSALEAMACEVPVISSNVGGLPEVNIHGQTGYLSAIGDVENMAKNTLRILANPKIHQQFRKNALAQAETFSLDKVLPVYEAYYQHVMQVGAR